MKKKKNQNKGQKGYLAWNKKMSICKTLVLFAISFAVYAMGIWSTGSNQNLLTIVAVLGCLPACRSAANLIALLRCHEISESDYRKISAKIRTAESLTDLEFTSYERTYQVQHMALSGVELIGYMADPFADIKGCEKHLEGMFMRNQLSEVHIRIFKELPKYLNRLDELEKAHRDIWSVLLQVMEEGVLTDSRGRKTDFRNTVLVMTSNLGARCLAGQASPLGFGAAAEETARRGKKALQEAKDYFRPELMGRLDDVVLFDPLGPAQLAAIADRLLCELEERAARQGYTLRHTPAAAAALAGDTVPAYGARELRRKVSRAVEQALADRIAAGTARPGVLFVADAAPDGHITLTMGDVAACAS